jgi:DNA-binding CsgD family transcriptional regulator
MVEVIGRYSNHSEQGELLRRLLEIVPDGPRKAKIQTRKQVQRRLRPREIDDLVTAYQAGISVYELADRHRIHRATVSLLLERRGVPRRYRLLEGERLGEAIGLYKGGQSLSTIGSGMGVSPETVRNVLIRAGVTLRPRPGWNGKC